MRLGYVLYGFGIAGLSSMWTRMSIAETDFISTVAVGAGFGCLLGIGAVMIGHDE